MAGLGSGCKNTLSWGFFACSLERYRTLRAREASARRACRGSSWEVNRLHVRRRRLTCCAVAAWSGALALNVNRVE